MRSGGALSSRAVTIAQHPWSRDMPPHMAVHIRWPCSIIGYPGQGQPHSFHDIRRMVHSVGCILKLRGGRGSNNDKSVLIVKGPEAPAVYEMVFRESEKAGLDLSKVPLRPVITIGVNEDNADDNMAGVKGASEAAFIDVNWKKDTNDEDIDMCLVIFFQECHGAETVNLKPKKMAMAVPCNFVLIRIMTMTKKAAMAVPRRSLLSRHWLFQLHPMSMPCHLLLNLKTVPGLHHVLCQDSGGATAMTAAITPPSPQKKRVWTAHPSQKQCRRTAAWVSTKLAWMWTPTLQALLPKDAQEHDRVM